MKHRKLRIAWSTVCATLCLFVLALWIRSYYCWDVFNIPVTPFASQAGSAQGTLYIFENQRLGQFLPVPWSIRSFSVVYQDRQIEKDFGGNFQGTLGFGEINGRLVTVYCAPHWFAALILALVSRLPWVTWNSRFSLRTLLVATTLVAVVLGLIVWAAK
jgi:hypothetical protein